MTQTQNGGFGVLGLAPKLLAILEQNKFLKPTPIQHQAIPAAIEGKDIVGIAQTGTGKTLAFGLPTIQRLAQHKGRALILLPTRELAAQVEESLQKVGRPLGLKTAVLIGGASMRHQMLQLRRDPHIIIATPGRLVDHLQQKTVTLSKINIVVLDEADRMLDIGFAPQIKQIMDLVPKERQTMLFSATMPNEIASLAAKYMRLPMRIEVAPAGTASSQVEHEVFVVSKEIKLQLLEKLLTDTAGSILVFSRTKHGAKKIAAAVRHMGQQAVEMHSDRSQGQRRAALEGFKIGTFRILVATDIAARGIDVTGIALVINYDLPANSDDYVHRIGRTGRAGNTGKAVSFAEPNQRGDVRDIERLIRKSIKILPLPVLPPKRIPPPRAHFNKAHTGSHTNKFERERGHEMGYRFKKRPKFQKKFQRQFSKHA